MNIWQQGEFDTESIEEASLLLSVLSFLPMLRKNFKHMSLEQVSHFGKAPENELIRWSRFRLLLNKVPLIEFKHLLREEFPVQEVLYPFVKNIFLQANVAQLRNNNICIIDTPGLNANSIDDLGLCSESMEILKRHSNFTELICRIKSQV